MPSKGDARSDHSHLQSDHRNRSPGCGQQHRCGGARASHAAAIAAGRAARRHAASAQGGQLSRCCSEAATRGGVEAPAAVRGAHNGMPHAAQQSKARRKEAGGCRSRPAAVPLDLHALCAVHVVAFPVRSVVLGVGGGSGFEVLRVLGEFHSLGLGPRLVAELDQSHHHGQPEASDQDIENPSNIAQAQSARLVLRETSHAVSLAVRSRQTDRQTENRLLGTEP